VSLTELRTERLVLRPLAVSDLDEYVALFEDAEVLRYIGDGTAATREEVKEWHARTLRRNETEGWHMRTVRQHDGTFVGRCGIAVHDLEHGVEREVGYIIAREHWGKGYATEAASAVRDHAFGTLGLHRLVALIAPGNDASVRVAEKLGMTYEREVPFHDRPAMLFVLEA
jgi:RimJ/RimL family protein N-acetyltransferase